MAGTSPNKSTLRRRLRSALAHKSLADTLLDTLNELQTKLNAALAKLAVDADHPAVAEVTNVTAAGTGASLDTATAKYFTLHDGANAAHYVWYQVSDGANFPQTDPAPGGTGHLVTVLAADTAAQIATKTQAVVNPLAEFVMPAPTSALMTITNAVAGAATDATAGTSGFTVAVVTQGSAAVTTIDTDFVATCSIPAANILNPDAVKDGQHRSTLRKTLQSALTHRQVANAYLDAVVTLQNAHNALMTKLDAEGGTLASTDFASTLSVVAYTAASVLAPAQDQQPLSRVLQVSLANNTLGQKMTSALVDTQASLNGALADLDAGSTLGAAAREVSVIDPESTL